MCVAFLSSLGGGHNWKTSVGKSWEADIVWESSSSVGEGSHAVDGRHAVGDAGGEEGGGESSLRSSQGGGQGVDRGGRLLGSQTSSGSRVESSLELSLGGCHVLTVSQIGGGDLLGLHVLVDRSEVSVRPRHGRVKCCLELRLGSGHLGRVLQWEAGSNSQERGQHLKVRIQRAVIPGCDFTSLCIVW